MIQMETSELLISKELRTKINTICKFANVRYSLENGSIVDFKGTNIAFVKPHILRVKNNDYLIFEDSDVVYINGYHKKIPFNQLGNQLKK